MPSCIVTGGSGFIGTHLIRAILDQGVFTKIYVLDLSQPAETAEEVEFVACDIRNPIDVSVDEDCDVCFHLAALCKEPGYDWDEYYRTNLLGTKHVCDWLNKVGIKKLVFASTMMVYRAGEKRYRETSLTAPNTAYGISKLLAEKEVQLWQSDDLSRSAISARLAVIFGPGDTGHYPKLIRAVKRGRFAFIGRKDTVKSGAYVKDAAKFLLLQSANGSGAHVYNFAINREISIKEICDTIGSVFGSRGKIPTVPYRLAMLLAYFAEFIDYCGIKNDVHHRRIQKMYFSTNVDSSLAIEHGFVFDYDLSDALIDWKKCVPELAH